ncbi:MAG: ATP-dependent 6-phosphofructokinase [Paludibacteraceae bacterium]|nr:ATP-dependent 6-phosphofructokinase [Paludibacteraceae bacterium]
MDMNFTIKTLGTCKIKTPLQLSKVKGDGIYDFVEDGERVLYSSSLHEVMTAIKNGEDLVSFEKPGPKEFLYFEPAKTKVAIVTCGGLCPGLNNVIRGLVTHLWNRYGVTNIVGIQYGYAGLNPDLQIPFINLDPDLVDDIHKDGGSMLASSRGEQPSEIIVDTLERNNINILFCVGGDGTLRGAHAIHQEIEKRGLKIAVAGVPKTIDNDINLIEKSFGFESAFTAAQSIILNAHYEAKGAINGVALIKLMGRDSGFIAANVALAVPDVNFCLIPEMDFDLDNPETQNGFLNILEKRLERKKHAVIVVAEGAGQQFFQGERKKDASGNVLHEDIGIFMKNQITDYFKKKNIPICVKYIDPSYIIRSIPANANDSKFCEQLTHNAVHAAMAGRTDFVVGYWNGSFTLLPIDIATAQRKKVNVESEFWWSVVEATGQPLEMK